MSSGAANTAILRPEEIPANLASEVLLDLGLKPVLRELHDVDQLDEAQTHWQGRGYQTLAGEEVVEDEATRALVTDVDQEHTVRPLETHPVVERLLRLGGPLADRLLLERSGRVYRWLADRLGADQEPEEGGPSGDGPSRRCQTLYVGRDAGMLAAAKQLDRMSADALETAGAVELGRLLGYPSCCIDAFNALERRWPNRIPIAAAAGRTRTFRARLNNLSLTRFAYIAHFPCRYDCPHSLALADAAAAELDDRNPGLVAFVDQALALPRLYLDDATQGIFMDATLHGRNRLTFGRLLELGELWPDPHGRDAQTPELWGALSGCNEARWGPDGAELRARGKRVDLPGEALVLPFLTER